MGRIAWSSVCYPIGLLLLLGSCPTVFGQQEGDDLGGRVAFAEEATGAIVDMEPQLTDTEQRLVELEKMVKDLQAKAAKKTLPSVTIGLR